jgi:hypothetical protein
VPSSGAANPVSYDTQVADTGGLDPAADYGVSDYSGDSFDGGDF